MTSRQMFSPDTLARASRRLLASLSLGLLAAPLAFADGSEFGYNVQTSLWTTHFRPQPGHNNTQRFLGLERFGSNLLSEPLEQRSDWFERSRPLLGYAYFKNSFHQSSSYVYVGFLDPLYQRDRSELYMKVTAGFIHGYSGEYRDKIPLNHFGVAPAVIPSLGVRYRQFNVEVIQLGVAGVMLNAGFSF